MQKINQKLLVEVPLFEKVENYPVASLHLEHLHYFSENTLIEILTKAGYEPDYIEKINIIYKLSTLHIANLHISSTAFGKIVPIFHYKLLFVFPYVIIHH